MSFLCCFDGFYVTLPKPGLVSLYRQSGLVSLYRQSSLVSLYRQSGLVSLFYRQSSGTFLDYIIAMQHSAMFRSWSCTWKTSQLATVECAGNDCSHPEEVIEAEQCYGDAFQWYCPSSGVNIALAAIRSVNKLG